MTDIAYPSVPEGARPSVVARQLNITGRRTHCGVVLSGREVGVIPDDECCPEPAGFRVDYYDYRCGITTGGVFTPGESINARVCAIHEQVMRDAPGFIRSRTFTPTAAGQ